MYCQRLKVLLPLALVFCLNCSFPAEAAETASSKLKTLQLGLVSTKPRERIEEHLDLINYVASKLSPGMQGKVVIASDPAELAKLIQAEKRTHTLGVRNCAHWTS